MNLYEALLVRKTVRKYNMTPIEQIRLDGIMGFANSLPMLYPEIRVEYRILPQTDIGKFFTGPITVKAPYYFVITSTNKQGHLINAGYLMHQISLYMTAKEIGSCYLGMLKPKKGVIEGQNMKYVMTLAFGTTDHEVYRLADRAKRLPLHDIAVFKSEVSKDVETIVEAARLAPSSMNNQPWRLVVYDNRIHIFCKKNLFLTSVLSETKQMDIGICIANLMVAAEELWIDMKPMRMENIAQTSFKKNDYIITLKMVE